MKDLEEKLFIYGGGGRERELALYWENVIIWELKYKNAGNSEESLPPIPLHSPCNCVEIGISFKHKSHILFFMFYLTFFSFSFSLHHCVGIAYCRLGEE